MYQNPQDLNEYHELVFNYLEEIGYPEMILEFNEIEVAKSLAFAICMYHARGISWRMAACSIFGMTWETQIVPRYTGQTVN